MQQSSAHTAFDPAGRARDLIDYQTDGSREGKPLSLILGGGAVALLSMALIALLAYQTWYLGDVDEDRAYFGVSFLFAIYVLGLFLFCYGYSLNDTAKAVQMTLVLAVISVVAVFAVIAMFALLAKLKGAQSLEAVAGAGEDRAEPAARVLASMVFTGDSDRGPRAEDSELFVIHCQGCGEKFIPIPPRAVCPSCGRAALPAG